MMTPEQTIQDAKLYLECLNLEGFDSKKLLELIDVLERFETKLGHMVLTSHSACNTKNG